MYGPLICHTHTLPASVQRTFVNTFKVAISLKPLRPEQWLEFKPPSVIEGLNDSKVYGDAFVKLRTK